METKVQTSVVEIDGVKYNKKIILTPVKTEKKCCGCKKIKSLTEFHKNKGRADGVNTTCKECLKIYHQERKKKKTIKS